MDNVAVSGSPVLFLDEHLIAVNKPSGMLVHRGWGDDDFVAMDWAKQLSGGWVFPVHRLDRGTSGVLLFGRTSEVAAAVQAQMQEGTVQKRYLAFVRGRAPSEGVVDQPVPRTEGGTRVPALTRVRRLFVTEVEGAGEAGAPRCFSVVEASPETGRLHQVRRHLKHWGHPIIGDVNYGRGELNRLFRERVGLVRLALHASSLRLVHPATGEALEIRAPAPRDLVEPLSQVGVPEEAWRA